VHPVWCDFQRSIVSKKLLDVLEVGSCSQLHKGSKTSQFIVALESVKALKNGHPFLLWPAV
jgi:hypothetical protein